VLVQAKVEPGNVGTVQLAPTIQATRSNAARVHGGAGPPLLDWLDRGRLASDTLQSEQGTRFLGKRNRNCTLFVDQDVPHGPYHRWFPARELCALVAEDHLINTDARSALVCTPWDLLAGGAAFAGDGMARLLRASYDLPDDRAWRPLAAVLDLLARPAAWLEVPAEVPLDRLDGWRMADEGPEPAESGPFRLRHVRVQALSREVPRWDQPLIQSGERGEVILPLGRWRGVPHFGFKIAIEPGFEKRRELTPAGAVAPGRELVSCLQSEEGGRFLFDENRYALLDVGELPGPQLEHVWLSLAQVRALLERGESLTNEARSAISLVLSWLCP
jgi:oxidase EvaA